MMSINARLSTKMLILTAVLGLVIWYTTDNYQTDSLEATFQESLAQRFSVQSQEHRTLFDKHVKTYSRMARLLSSTAAIHNHVDNNKWPEKAGTVSIKSHQSVPEWLPDQSVLRTIVTPRYTILLNAEKQAVEVYNWHEDKIPKELLQPDFLLLRFALNQSYITYINDAAYIVTAENIKTRKGNRAMLILSSPIDNLFIRNALSSSASSATFALLNEDERTVLVSSDPDKIPTGTDINDLENIYKITGKGFFDYGSTDLVVKFISFIPLDEVHKLTRSALAKERTSRAITTFTYTATFMVIILLLTRRLTRLTRKVTDFSRRMSIKQPDMDIKDELHLLDERFKTLVSAIKNETAALEYQASHDPLTDLPNRKKLNERLQDELIKSEEYGTTLCLFVSDLNHFKEINDTLGHHIGDAVLQQAAERLHNSIRRTDTVARLGGDEFSILLPNMKLHEARRTAEAIVDIFSIPFVVNEHHLNVGISIGIVECPMHGNDVNILLQRADVAMYKAKRDNLGYFLYKPEIDDHNIGRLALTTDLQNAIDKELFELYFQAKLDLDSGKLFGAEALLRWNHPQRGEISPEEFIPLAEKKGVIRPLTYWVVEESIKRCAEWHALGFDLSVAINISAQCLHENQLTQTLRESLNKYNLPPSSCMLEITESDIMRDPIRAKYILQEMESIGVRLSVDDFGTGYSSLAYLKQLPVSEIKIDKSFVMEMIEDDNDKVIVHAIIELAHNLDMRVVAEGVESDKTLSMLRSLNCNMAQGFHISKPISNDDFIEFMKNNHELYKNTKRLPVPANVTHINETSRRKK